MITAGDVAPGVEPVSPMQMGGLFASRFGADTGGSGRTGNPPRAAVAGCALNCSRRPDVAIEITGPGAWSAPTGAARLRQTDGADAVADPGVPMQQM